MLMFILFMILYLIVACIIVGVIRGCVPEGKEPDELFMAFAAFFWPIAIVLFLGNAIAVAVEVIIKRNRKGRPKDPKENP